MISLQEARKRRTNQTQSKGKKVFNKMCENQ